MKRTTRLAVILAIAISYFVVELAFGFRTRSVALIADAFHYLNDILAYVIAYIAAYLGDHGHRSSKYTYAFHRAEIVGAFFNGVFLLALALSIFLQSIERFVNVEPVTDPLSIIIVGGVGIALNVVMVFFAHEHGGHSHSHSHGAVEGSVPADQEANVAAPLHACSPEADATRPSATSYGAAIDCHTLSARAGALRGCGTGGNIPPPAPATTTTTELDPLLDTTGGEEDKRNWHLEHHHVALSSQPRKKELNLGLLGVFIHIVGDAINTLGVVVAGIIILLLSSPMKYYADPAISLVISLMIFASALPLTKRAGHILLESTPAHIPLPYLTADLLSLPHVRAVHDLHVWQLSQSVTLASLSLEMEGGAEKSMADWSRVEGMVRHCFWEYGIGHVTVSPLVVAEPRNMSA